MALTEEQRRRIEEKRGEALAKRKNKIPQTSSGGVIQAGGSGAGVSGGGSGRGVFVGGGGVSGSGGGVSGSGGGGLTDEQKRIVEQNRQAALHRKNVVHPSSATTVPSLTAESFYNKSKPSVKTIGPNNLGTPFKPPRPHPSTTQSSFSNSNLFSKSDTNPFGKSNTNPFRKSATNPFSKGNTNPFSKGNTNPFSKGNTNPFSKGNTNSDSRSSLSSLINKQSSLVLNGSAVTSGAINSGLAAVKHGGKCIKANCTLVERNRFQVVTTYHETLIKVFKTMKTGVYNAKTRIWSFSLEEHDKLVREAGVLKGEVELIPLPRWILDTFRKPLSYDVESIDLSKIEPKILESLMPFQLQGIQFGISRAGRVLIADDMGLGKTIQALGLASYYRDAWPFLVVAPSSMRYAWESAILRWFPSLSADDISTITTGKDYIGSSSCIIISYDLLGKKANELAKKSFNLVIMDESHSIKNDKSARTKAAEPLMRECRYLILLSGTPALSRPVELYSQISALNPKLFKHQRDFGFRYCDGQLKKLGLREVYDFSGSSNMTELSLLLFVCLLEKCMIRRLKSDVLQQLPAKQRCMVVLDPGSVDSSSSMMRDKENAARKSGVHGLEKRGLLLEWYSATAQAKLKAVQEYVKDLLNSDKKFLLFCHHQVMMVGLAEVLNTAGTGFIQIDGSTPSELRRTYVDKFQTSPSCQVALLSITAANSGITLTSAHLVVFAEIYWNPGILTQAEDRAHRIGQTDSVSIQYLVAKGTADDELWPMIQKKLDVLNKAGLTKDNFQDSESTVVLSKGQKTIEDFFALNEEFPIAEFDESMMINETPLPAIETLRDPNDGTTANIVPQYVSDVATANIDLPDAPDVATANIELDEDLFDDEWEEDLQELESPAKKTKVF